MAEVGLPAALGGNPIFADLVPIVRPVLPSVEEIGPPLAEALASGQLTRAGQGRALEEEVAAVCGTRHAVAVSSCTAGLMLALRGLEDGAEVILPSFTFMATAAAVVWNGLTPVFAESDPETMNVIPESVADLVGPRTQAIVAVHNFGAPAAVEALEEIAASRGLRLIFDAAHALGSQANGQPVGGFGDAEVFSLSPTKVVVGCEGGIVTSDDEELAERIRVGREYGNPGNYNSVFVGLNARLSEPHAIIARWSLSRLASHIARRNEIVSGIAERLGSLPGLRFQKVLDGARCAYKDLTIAIDAQEAGITRDQVASALRGEAIDTRAYYSPAVHQMTAYKHYAGKASLPYTERLARECLSLPIHSRMTDDLADGICLAVERIWHWRDQVASQL